MQRSQQPGGECPQCGQATLVCNYNRFQREDLRIDSWEHKCPNCGWRDTKACRSDAAQEEGVDPNQCPWCGRAGLETT